VRKKPFDDIRVRQALTMAIDRWGGSEALSKISVLRHVGGFTRPGFEFALSNEELAKLPGYARDMAVARSEARRLLKEAGAEGLKLRLVNRTVAEPYQPAGLYVIDQWRRIGVEAEHVQLESRPYFDAQAQGAFDAVIEFIADYVDDPSIHFTKLVTAKKSPISFSGHSNAVLDDLFEKQMRANAPDERKRITRQLERVAITEANSAMLFWFHRIIVNHAKVKGWQLLPAHYGGQDLVEVWLDQ
jgi:peptide/nickel transport system substrate-binding protein